MAEIALLAATKLTTAMTATSGLASALTIGSGVLGTVSAYQTSKAQKAAAQNQALQEEENRKRVIAAGNVQAQDQDFANMVELGMLDVRQAGSGLSMAGGSSVRARRAARVLARRDSSRIIDDASVQGTSAENRAAANRAQADSINPFMDALGTGLSASADLMTSADVLNPRTRTRIVGVG